MTAPGPLQHVSSHNHGDAASSAQGRGARGDASSPTAGPRSWGPVFPCADSRRQKQMRSHKRRVPSAGDGQQQESSRSKR